jgi:hypothetical protein
MAEALRHGFSIAIRIYIKAWPTKGSLLAGPPPGQLIDLLVHAGLRSRRPDGSSERLWGLSDWERVGNFT